MVALYPLSLRLTRSGADPACKSVDEASKVLFCSGDKPLTAIPPTRSALLQHIRRAAYQGEHIWGTADQVNYLPPPPSSTVG